MICEFILPYQEEKLDLLENSIKIGIDHGAIDAINKGVKLDYALGDFDSISETNFNLIKSKVKNIVKLNTVKDDTDTEHAINLFKDANKIIIHGGLEGKRISHLVANLNLILKFPQVVIKDDKTLIYKLEPVMKLTDKSYKFISIFAKPGSVISLQGFKYNLTNYKFLENDNLCISNELISEVGKIQFSGEGLIILEKDDNLLI